MDSIKKILQGSLLVAGTTIGAGMLALPLVSLKAGFYPGLATLFIVWLFMLFTGLFLLEVSYQSIENESLYSLSCSLLGKSNGRVVSFLFFFLYFSLMVAYHAAGSYLVKDLTSSLLSISLSYSESLVAFTVFFFLIASRSHTHIDKWNTALSVGMIISLLLLVYFAFGHINIMHFNSSDITAMPYALPVLCSAFGYHNLVPSLPRHYKLDIVSLRYMIFFGTLLPLICYSVWQCIVFGVIPVQTLEALSNAGEPVTFAFKSVTGTSTMYFLGQLFAFFAVSTSTLGVSFSLIDYTSDVLSGVNIKVKRPLLCIFPILLPAVCAYFNPHIFDTALGIAGGYGEAALNGALPLILVVAASRYSTFSKFFTSKVLIGVLFAFSVYIAYIETLHLFF